MNDRKSYPIRVFLTVVDELELWTTTRLNPNSLEYRHISQIDKLKAENKRYRKALEKIRDATPANEHKKWPHHHFYLKTARDALKPTE